MKSIVAFIFVLASLQLAKAFLLTKAVRSTCSSLFAKVPEKHGKPIKSTNIKPNLTNKPVDASKKSTAKSIVKKEDTQKRTKDISSKSDDDSDVKELAKLDDDERLQKVIARAGIASRRKAEQLILDGRVTVNGKMVKEVGMKVDARTDLISVDGAKIQLPDAKKTFWVVVHKPRNTLTTTSDEKERDTIMDLVPKAAELRLLPVGRLERDTTGVVILTNENGWIHPLTHPSFRIQKKFQVIVEGIPSEETLDKIRTDFQLEDRTMMAGCEVKLVDSDKKQNLAALEIQFEDSQPWAIQKMLDFIGHSPTQIKRTAFGPIALNNLKRGQWRELTPSEVQKLKEACTKAPEDQLIKKRVQTNKRIQRARAQGNLFYTRKPGSGYYLRTISRALPSKGEDGKTMVAKPAHLRTRRGPPSATAGATSEARDTAQENNSFSSAKSTTSRVYTRKSRSSTGSREVRDSEPPSSRDSKFSSRRSAPQQRAPAMSPRSYSTNGPRSGGRAKKTN